VKPEYTPQARLHLELISEHLTPRNLAAAQRIATQIQNTVEFLSHFPYAGHPGIAPGTREMPVRDSRYIIVYRVEPRGDDSAIVVIGIYHGAQRRPVS
jgi:toxin ParE1/3/4